jgi:hypothetical protein
MKLSAKVKYTWLILDGTPEIRFERARTALVEGSQERAWAEWHKGRRRGIEIGPTRKADLLARTSRDGSDTTAVR